MNEAPTTLAKVVEAVAKALCQSGKFETGDGICAAICMGQLGYVRRNCSHYVRVHGKLAREIVAALQSSASIPVNMILSCPSCGYQHVDEPSEGWTNPPHKSHLCHNCKTIWRPSDVPTNGVAEIKTRGSTDTWAYLREFVAKAQSVSIPEGCWLIETGQQTWWNGRRVGENAAFVSDPNEAVRFARFEDAEIVRCWLLEKGEQRLRSTEHIFGLAASPTREEE